MEWPLDRVVAEALWVALVTDTGRFAYDSTTPATLRTACDLLKYGVRTTARLLGTVRDLVEEEGDFVLRHGTGNLDDVLGLGLGTAHLPEIIARERDLGDLAVLPDVEGTPGAALELGRARVEGTVEDVVDVGRAHAVLEQVAGGAERPPAAPSRHPWGPRSARCAPPSRTFSRTACAARRRRCARLHPQHRQRHPRRPSN